MRNDEKNKRTNAEATHEIDPARMKLEASSRTYLQANSVRSLRAKRRLPEGNSVASVHPISEKRTAKKAIPIKQTNQEARLTTHNSPSTKRRV